MDRYRLCCGATHSALHSGIPGALLWETHAAVHNCAHPPTEWNSNSLTLTESRTQDAVVRFMNRIQKAALLYLAFLAVLVWGIGIGRHRIFPYSLIQEVVAYTQGNDEIITGAIGRIENDLDVKPARFIVGYPAAASESYRPLQLSGLRTRREPPRVYLAPDAPRKYRVVFGAFDFEASFWGAVLLDPDGKVVHVWHLSSDDLPLSKEPETRKVMYGVSLLRDGSIIFSMQEAAGGIVRTDACSRRVWSLDGSFHHVASATDQGTFWTFEGDQQDFDHLLDLVDLKSGRIIKKINMKDVRAANPEIRIFDLQKKEEVKDRVHGNDIDALPVGLAADFPQFEAGDVLVSFRTTNLVFVLDPDTLKIKWWRMGAWDRQHDPDWDKGGRITVFSNNERASGQHSDIVAIDPKTFKSEILVDGSKYNFYSAINGNHQVTDAGSVLIASSVQGRAFEVGRDGKVLFDFVNTYERSANENLFVSDVLAIDADFFEGGKLPQCKGSQS